jgi:hypothetical protein
MTFLRVFWPIALARYQIILSTVSFASDPELAKKTLLIGTGARAIRRSARSTAGRTARPLKL